MQQPYKILIYGTGVIGSIYATKLSNAGFNVSVYSRGNRLQVLQKKGLLYHDNGTIKKADVKVLEEIRSTDIFDFIFVTVRRKQIEKALMELKSNNSPNIITMVNTANGYETWEDIIGKDRLIPAFPGAGGKIENDILTYQLTSRIVQPTTFGELNGERTHRIRKLHEIFVSSKIPCSISKNMDVWQKCHLAMVIPLANGIYLDGGNNYTTSKNKQALNYMSVELKRNFNSIKNMGLQITPKKLNIFSLLPHWLISIVLGYIYNTKFAETLINSHVQVARDETEILSREFSNFIADK